MDYFKEWLLSNGESKEEKLKVLGLTKVFKTKNIALVYIRLNQLYQEAISVYVDCIRRVSQGAKISDLPTKLANYPFLGVHIDEPSLHPNVNTWSFGWSKHLGLHGSTVTMPSVSKRFIIPTLKRVKRAYGSEFIVADSGVPISPKFALRGLRLDIPRELQEFWSKLETRLEEEVGHSNAPVINDSDAFHQLKKPNSLLRLKPFVRQPVDCSMFRSSASMNDRLAHSFCYQTNIGPGGIVGLNQVQGIVVFVNYANSLKRSPREV